jgi:hypothetical protein
VKAASGCNQHRSSCCNIHSLNQVFAVIFVLWPYSSIVGQYGRAARFWQPSEQLLHLLRVRHRAPFLRLTPADLNAVSGIALKIPGLDGGVKHTLQS